MSGRGQLDNQFGRPWLEDAISFVNLVRVRFRRQPHKYEYFLITMGEYRRHYIDAHEVVARVIGLFRRHPDLLVAFSRFLPRGYMRGRRVVAQIVTSAGAQFNRKNYWLEKSIEFCLNFSALRILSIFFSSDMSE